MTQLTASLNSLYKIHYRPRPIHQGLLCRPKLIRVKNYDFDFFHEKKAFKC